MTVSSRPTPNSQEPEPQHSGVQQTQGPVARLQSEVAINPQLLPSSIRRKVVGKPPAIPPVAITGNSQVGKNDETKDHYSHHITVPLAALNSSTEPTHRPAPFIQSVLPKKAQEMQSVGENGEINPGERIAHAGKAPDRQASLRRDVTLRTTNKYVAAPQEIENGNIILYRSPNFFLRTAYRPGQKQNPLRKPTGNTMVTPKVMPHQETRIAASDTHVMPNVTLNTAKQTRAIPLPTWLEAVLIVLSLATAFVIHAYNMINFPRYELDEGTYMSNAWAITQGLISPYPYGYGHPPLAWMQIAAWMQLTGGPFTFGNALNSGRVFMLFYAAGSALLVYLIARRMGGSASAGILARVVFSFSPLGITYHRQVFLDNIATFWMLLSLYLLVVGNSRLQYIIGAAVAFGFSVLSKEVYLICFPVLIYAAWLYTTKFQRKFGMVAFIYAAIAVCSAFVLMAVLKDELFPYSWHLPWDTHPHLSMLDTLVGQAQRGQVGGSFQASWEIWIENDPLIIILSIVFPLFNLVYGWWNRKHLMLSLMAIIFWLLLVRGGQVLSFYILPLIPLAALNMALALNTVMGWLGKLVRFDLVRVALLIVVIAIVLPYDIKATGFRFYQHPTSAQQDAMVWVRNHVSHNAFIVINSYLYVDLQLPGGQGTGDGAPYPHAEVYWNVAFDPELHDRTLQKNWDRIDYIVADSEMLNDIKTYGSGMNLIKQAYQHSVLRAEFRADDHNLQIVV